MDRQKPILFRIGSKRPIDSVRGSNRSVTFNFDGLLKSSNLVAVESRPILLKISECWYNLEAYEWNL